MRLMVHDVDLGRAVFWEMQDLLPRSVTNPCWDNSFAAIYPKDNPSVLFNMCVSVVRILLKTLTFQDEFTQREGVWMLQNGATKEMTSQALLKVGDETHGQFKDRCRAILMASGSMPFTKIADKLNTDLVGRMTYFRDAVSHADALLDLLVRGENVSVGSACAARRRGSRAGDSPRSRINLCLPSPPPLPPHAWRPWP